MYPSRDMNPIAIAHLQRERLEADLAFLERAEAPGHGLILRLRSLWRAVLGREAGEDRSEGGAPDERWSAPDTWRHRDIRASALNPFLPR